MQVNPNVIRIGLALGSLILVYQLKVSGRLARDPHLGKAILSSINLSQINEINLESNQSKTSLRKAEDGIWIIKELNDFPAQNELVDQILTGAANAKILQVAAFNKDDALELGKSETPLRIEFGGESVTSRLKLEFLALRNRSRGRYFGFQGEDRTYVTDQVFNYSADPETWRMIRLVPIPPAKFTKISANAPNDGVSLSFSRGDSQSKLQAEGKPALSVEHLSLAEMLISVPWTLTASNYRPLTDNTSESIVPSKPDVDLLLTTNYGSQVRVTLTRLAAEPNSNWKASLSYLEVADQDKKDAQTLEKINHGWTIEIPQGRGEQIRNAIISLHSTPAQAQAPADTSNTEETQSSPPKSEEK